MYTKTKVTCLYLQTSDLYNLFYYQLILFIKLAVAPTYSALSAIIGDADL